MNFNEVWGEMSTAFRRWWARFANDEGVPLRDSDEHASMCMMGGEL